MNQAELQPYKVGALMYVPASKIGVGEKVCAGAFQELNSLAFCLEDAVAVGEVKQAEEQLVKTLAFIDGHALDSGLSLPLLFVRVRNCSQFRRLSSLLGGLTDLLTGVIFPKFDLSNAAEYCALTGEMNAGRAAPLSIMPTLESGSVMDLGTRERTLLGLRELLDGYKGYVLNIRVGAMDFCKSYGLRRTIDQTIYDIAVVRDVLTDILTIFADRYVVSAPVWEYFQDETSDTGWLTGLERELRLDMANGFLGKTIIHPSQIALVRKWLQPTHTDVSDAKAILAWEDEAFGVARSVGGNRMNERATHVKWAEKILMLSEIYGVREWEAG